MRLQPLIRVAATLALVCARMPFNSLSVNAQVIDFSQIDAFKSMGRGTQLGAYYRRQLSMMVNGTRYSLRSWSPIP
ncbi:MAG: hypothetical protein WBW99_23345, partial [Pseudolabrys sp.]